MNPKCIEDVSKWAKESGHNQVHAHVMDGLEFMKASKISVDLLYLDYWTDDPPGTLFGTGREQSYLKAYEVAEPKLSKRSLILIDDTDRLGPWKHTQIIPAAKKSGFDLLWTGRQTLLARGMFNF
jgi:hypothetical protein